MTVAEALNRAVAALDAAEKAMTTAGTLALVEVSKQWIAVADEIRYQQR